MPRCHDATMPRYAECSVGAKFQRLYALSDTFDTPNRKCGEWCKNDRNTFCEMTWTWTSHVACHIPLMRVLDLKRTVLNTFRWWTQQCLELEEKKKTRAPALNREKEVESSFECNWQCRQLIETVLWALNVPRSSSLVTLYYFYFYFYFFTGLQTDGKSSVSNS